METRCLKSSCQTTWWQSRGVASDFLLREKDVYIHTCSIEPTVNTTVMYFERYIFDLLLFVFHWFLASIAYDSDLNSAHVYSDAIDHNWDLSNSIILFTIGSRVLLSALFVPLI